jgi:hypothetical protein
MQIKVRKKVDRQHRQIQELIHICRVIDSEVGGSS